MKRNLNSLFCKFNLFKFNFGNKYIKACTVVFSLYVLIVPIINAQPVNASVTFTVTNIPGQVTGEFFVELPDSLGWSSIEVELKDLINDTILFTQEFVFDQILGLPSGMSWLRNGNNVYLGTGIIPERSVWAGKVRIKNISNVWTDPLEFIFQ